MDQENCKIFGNTLIENQDFGIDVHSSAGQNILNHNILINNTPYQAKDEGSGNIWYNQSSLEGNYWSDWGGVGNYAISGTKGAVDLYPLSLSLIMPTLDHPMDIVFNYGATRQNITWNPQDPDNKPANYIINHNETSIETGLWESNESILLSLNGLEVGKHWFMIKVIDCNHLSVSDIVWVTVLPSIITETSETSIETTIITTDINTNVTTSMTTRLTATTSVSLTGFSSITSSINVVSIIITLLISIFFRRNKVKKRIQ